MYLKEIEIKGFKSFANKIKLNITPGITVIVGPNGCGKSNIIDAVRWLLGEQNIRSLRGIKATDIIFSGSKEQKMKNYAQVSMLFDNSDRLFSLDSEDVEVKRIIYRSGDTENYINGVPCKLKNIQELFLGTGLGKNSYSIIAQERTSFVLNARPTERRILFEEASDVAVYKNKKENALKKLETTENNLLRINDILSEVEETLAHYKKKYDDLETYKTYQDNVKKLEYYLFSQQFKSLQRNVNRVQKKIKNYGQEIIRIDKNLLFYRNKIIQTEQQKEQCEILLNENILNFQQNEIDKNKFSNQMSIIKQKELEIQKDIQNNKEGSSNSQKQFHKFQETLFEIEGTLQRSYQNESIIREKVEKAEAFLKKYNIIYHSYDKELVKAKNISEEISNIYEDYREEKIKKESEVRTRRLSLSEIERESNFLIDKINNNQKTIKHLKKELNSLECKNIQLVAEKEREKKELSDKETLIENERNIIKKLENDLVLKNKEVDFLEEVLKTVQNSNLEKSNFFVSESHITNEFNIIELKNIIKDVPDDLKQVFALILDDEKRYAHLTNINSIFKCENIFLDLEKNNARLNIIADNLVQTSQHKLKILEENCGIEKDKVIGLANKLISYPEEYKKQIEAVLGHILIVKDKSSAFKIAEYSKGKWIVISLDGVLINERGIVALNIFLKGISKDSYQISDKKRLELKQDIHDLAKYLSKKQLYLETELKKQKELFEDMKNIANRLEKNLLSINKINLELTKIDNNSKESENLLNSLITKKNCEMDNIEILERDIKITTQSLEDIKIYHSDIISLVNCLATFKNSSQKTVSLIMKNQENYRKELSWNQEKEDFLKNRKREMTQFVDNHHLEEQERKAKIKQYEQALQQLNSQKIGLVKKVDTISMVQNGINDYINKTKETIKEQDNLLRKSREQVDEELKSLEEKKNACHIDEMSKVQNQEKLNHLLQTIQGQYDASIEEVIGYSKHAENQTEALDKIAQYKEQIKQMGQINFNALQEYQEQSTKYEELYRKKEEITKSKEKLIALINEIDLIAQDHFYKTFQQVQENFQEIFSKLFQGGRVSLELSDNKKPLESGIEVLAQPPGKQVQHISLLSAGEKSLTAVALLFALWKANPTPFCFFDEIDSALDEANAVRLASYIKNDDLKSSQTIIITHQKEIMKIADALYGITMDRFGTSKLMSVKMADVKGNQN